MTELLYLHDHYLKEFDATVIETPDEKSVVLDRTAIYPRGGGQPSDRGTLTLKDGTVLEVMESKKEGSKAIDMLAKPMPQEVRASIISSTVHGKIDWPLRYLHMRYHTALHILSGVVYHRFQSRITGGQIYPDRARLDFTLADLSKERVQLIESEINRIVKEDHEVKTIWIAVDEATSRAELYRLSADLLPKGVDKLRIVDIVGFDAQLDGGTHVAGTSEVGVLKISRTENKGKYNKRIEVILTSP